MPVTVQASMNRADRRHAWWTKVIKGVDPAEIPVEVTTKVEFVINLKVAKALGLRIKPEVLYRADRLVR